MLPETHRKWGAINAVGEAIDVLFRTTGNDNLETVQKISELGKVWITFYKIINKY